MYLHVDNTEMKMYSINNGGNMMINNSFLHLMGRMLVVD
jgi:hypothetical protein